MPVLHILPLPLAAFWLCSFFGPVVLTEVSFHQGYDRQLQIKLSASYLAVLPEVFWWLRGFKIRSIVRSTSYRNTKVDLVDMLN